MAFTEQGVAMLSSVLNSDRAIDVNIAIMRTFVKLREVLNSNQEFEKKLSVPKFERHPPRPTINFKPSDFRGLFSFCGQLRSAVDAVTKAA